MARKKDSRDSREWFVRFRTDLFEAAESHTDARGFAQFDIDEAAAEACRLVINGAVEAFVTDGSGMTIIRVVE